MKKRVNRKPTWAWSSSVLGDILSFNVKLDEQLNNKANFLMGASAIIFVFIAGMITRGDFLEFRIGVQIAWVLIGIGTFISFLTAILIVTPKLRFFSKRERVKEDVFYYKNIIQFYTREEYVNMLNNLKKDGRMITAAFGNQIYSLSKNIIPFKSRLLKWSGWVLVLSLVIGILMIIYSTLG